jgi:hypothetical protein
VCSKTAVAVIAGHKLLAADRGSSASARRAASTGNHRRHNHAASQPVGSFFAHGDDLTGDFVPQDQRERMTGRHAIKRKSNISVAYAAAGNFDDDFVRARIKSLDFTSLKEGAGSL